MPFDLKDDVNGSFNFKGGNYSKKLLACWLVIGSDLPGKRYKHHNAGLVFCSKTIVLTLFLCEMHCDNIISFSKSDIAYKDYYLCESAEPFRRMTVISTPGHFDTRSFRHFLVVSTPRENFFAKSGRFDPNFFLRS